jgi:hypothetical protein
VCSRKWHDARRLGFGRRPRRERSACIGSHTGRASNAGRHPKDCGPEGCAENSPTPALLLSCDAQRHRALVAPWRRAVLSAARIMLFPGQHTSLSSIVRTVTNAASFLNPQMRQIDAVGETSRLRRSCSGHVWRGVQGHPARDRFEARYSRAGNSGSLRTGDTLSARTRSKMPGAISGSRS